jgi:hypothetical protein
MATLPGTTTSSWAYISEHGFNFTSILRALKVILLTIHPDGTLMKEYQPNFQGITEALADVAEMLQGHLARSAVWPSPDGSDAPGSGPDQLAEGSFWFDARQGRLFVRIEGQWWQTNGAESMTHVGPTPPQDPISGRWIERMGQEWFDTRSGRSFIYVDEPYAQGERGYYETVLQHDAEPAPAP